MNWRLVGLLAAFCLLSACEEKPVGQLEPIAPPPGTPASSARPAPTPAPAPAPTPDAAPAAPVDPSQVLLRWKLDEPAAFRLVVSADAPSRAAPSPPPDRKAPRVRKAAHGKQAPAEPSPTPAAETAAAPVSGIGLGTTYVVLRASAPVSGALPFALVPEATDAEVRQGTMSGRGFVLGGLSGPVRDLAVMVLELPELPVAPGATWPLATNLVDLDALPAGFRTQKTQQTSQVKLASVTPTADGDQVATLDYELLESVSGQQGYVRRERAPSGKGETAAGLHGHPESTPLTVRKPLGGGKRAAATPAAPALGAELSAEVRVSGRGEFLVKEGRWRSWEVRMTTRTVGLTLPGLSSGERVLRLTRVVPVPAELLQRLATK